MKPTLRYTDELQRCYDDQAEHFAQTRKRPRPEAALLQQRVSDLFSKQKKKINVLEVGCGAGRGYEFVGDFLPKKSTYTGIDISKKMLALAKKQFPAAERKAGEMTHYLNLCPQESIDLIIGIASVQHLYGATTRSLFFAQMYKTLARGGAVLLTNWAYSSWFLSTYRSSILGSLPHCLRKHERVRNDVMIPWKDPDYKKNTRIYDRYYHMFTLHELRQLATHHGFVIRELAYVDQDGQLTGERKNARNSFLVLEKALN